jgi:hypothetical protein
MSNVKLENRWSTRKDRFRRSLEADWFIYLEKLGFKGYYLTSLDIIGHAYRASFWLQEWNAFAYVIPRASRTDASIAELLDEAERLSRESPETDVLMFVGRPGKSGWMKLFSPEFAMFLDATNRSSTFSNRWTFGGLVDWLQSELVYWLPFSLAGGLFYSPIEKIWSELCDCAAPNCEQCRRFSVFHPSDMQNIDFENTKICPHQRRAVGAN